MPHRKKKPFIEKKKAVTFHLVHRSQRDPLAADETAPQRVLLPADKVDADKRREEQRTFGVFFDDDYNYLQHLKEVGPTELVPSGRPQSRIIVTDDGKVEEEEVEQIPPPTINLPSSVFASEFEEDVGLLNKAAPVRGLCLDLDPDVVAALDDDFDFSDPENQLEDDFILKANDLGSKDQRNENEGDDDEWEDVDDEEADSDESQDDDFDSEGPLSDEESRGEAGPMKEFLFMQEETKSRFSEYSMSSSVMRRNDQLTLLDERFEKFYEQFDEDEIGALDNAELEGFIQTDSARLQDVVKDYFKQKAKECVKLKDLKPIEGLDLIEEDEEVEEEMQTITKPIKVSAKTGIPLGVLPGRGPTAKQVERMERINDGDLPRVSTQQRSKHESTEEKKARKQAIKEERKERRVEKKANKLAFKVEKSRQEKEQLNLKQNLQGLKIA
ncbi:hypothetical protein AB205_0158480 [Aquarana catesbeiana]|uniref:Protein LTV1 homolog n=1 Tax=Aquarana catesbeiana TaxID=8400 RepID=A0A2G9SF86_AQUCT|nr:hypothetical protein AB205_0158480 [Aquarana catesbeiana]